MRGLQKHSLLRSSTRTSELDAPQYVIYAFAYGLLSADTAANPMPLYMYIYLYTHIYV